MLLLITVVIFFSSVWLALFLSKQITRPVEALADAMDKIAAGKYDHRVQLVSTGEMAELVRSFNHMAADLDASRQLAETSSAQVIAANMAIEERRRELETIVETIPSGVVTLDGAGVLFCGFNPAVSSSAMKAMRSTIRELKLLHQTQLSLQDIARQLNPLLRGWIEYYGRYAPSALYPLLRHVNQTLVAWVMRKFKRFTDHKIRASQFLQRLAAERTDLFVHWRLGMIGTFA